MIEKLIYTNELGNSVEISHYSLFHLEKHEGLGGIKNTIHTQKSPNQDGTTEISSNLEARDISIEGSINSIRKDEILRHRQTLLRVLNPKLKGRLKYQLGNFVREVDCTVELAPIFPNIESKFKKFLIQLYCPNPFFRDVSETKNDIAIWQPSFEFALEIPEEGIEMGYREPSLIVNVLNKGNVKSGIKIKFKALATVENPSLFNVNTREFIKINKTMEAGEVITVTTHDRNHKVLTTKNGVTSNAFNDIDLDSTFLQLDPGDNLFRYDADEGLDNLEVSIYHNSQYLGV